MSLNTAPADAALSDTALSDTDFSFDDSSFDELRDEAVRRFEALVDRVTDGLMSDPVDNGPAHDREACRLAAIALLAEANRAAFGTDSLVAQVLAGLPSS
jgi:hypothetical protein